MRSYYLSQRCKRSSIQPFNGRILRATCIYATVQLPCQHFVTLGTTHRVDARQGAILTRKQSTMGREEEREGENRETRTDFGGGELPESLQTVPFPLTNAVPGSVSFLRGQTLPTSAVCQNESPGIVLRHSYRSNPTNCGARPDRIWPTKTRCHSVYRVPLAFAGQGCPFAHTRPTRRLPQRHLAPTDIVELKRPPLR